MLEVNNYEAPDDFAQIMWALNLVVWPWVVYLGVKKGLKGET